MEPLTLGEFLYCILTQFTFVDTSCRGGVGVETSAAHIGYEFERVFYKLNYGYRAAIQSLYMVGSTHLLYDMSNSC